MKATYFAATAIATLALSGTAHAAFTITDLGTPTSEDAGPAPTLSTGNLETFVSGDATGRRSPYQDTSGNFLTGFDDAEYHVIGSTTQPAEAFFDFGGFFPILNILWGSPDSGSNPPATNSIEFFNTSVDASTPFLTVSGVDILAEQLPSAVEGLGFANISIDVSGHGLFDRIELNHGDNGGAAFEFAQVSAVPLPAAAWLMIGGLGAVAAAARHGRKKRAAANA